MYVANLKLSDPRAHQGVIREALKLPPDGLGWGASIQAMGIWKPSRRAPPDPKKGMLERMGKTQSSPAPAS